MLHHACCPVSRSFCMATWYIILWIQNYIWCMLPTQALFTSWMKQIGLDFSMHAHVNFQVLTVKCHCIRCLLKAYYLLCWCVFSMLTLFSWQFQCWLFFTVLTLHAIIILSLLYLGGTVHACTLFWKSNRGYIYTVKNGVSYIHPKVLHNHSY